MENLVFLDCVSFLPCPLRKLLEAFDFSAAKSWKLHDYIIEENLDYIGPIPDVSYFGLHEVGRPGGEAVSCVLREPEIGGAFRKQARASNLLSR